VIKNENWYAHQEAHRVHHGDSASLSHAVRKIVAKARKEEAKKVEPSG